MPTREPSLRRRTWWIPAGIGTASLALAAAALLTGPAPQSPATTPSPAAAEAPMPTAVAKPDLSAQERHDSADPLAEGDADAPVTLVVISDFQCQYCARWHAETLPVLRRDYVGDGRLRIEHRNIALYGPDSERASRAVLAAAAQGKGAEYADALFADGKPRTGGRLSEGALIEVAEELGLDPGRFESDLGSPEVRARATADAHEGEELGVFSTPAFIVDGEPMVGAQPTAVFTDAVDRALAEREG